ncbi:DUF2187 family protein [Bacillus methanolicus]|uniref:DUF2187 family protein n=1 Tax=Bacillus methanolicus TaxID=1471 RepID=UPI00200DA810|nr:DUF2187 family protein [Bacillus methanolicus]
MIGRLLIHIFRNPINKLEKGDFLAVVKMAQKGDVIIFLRNGIKLKGVVFKIRDNSALVNINKSIAANLGLETPFTVVNHKNYSVVKASEIL